MERMKCEECVHENICSLWVSAEGQDAACYTDDCFELKHNKNACKVSESFRDVLQYLNALGVYGFVIGLSGSIYLCDASYDPEVDRFTKNIIITDYRASRNVFDYKFNKVYVIADFVKLYTANV